MMKPSIAGLLRVLALACALVSPLAMAQKAYPSAEAAADAFTDALRKADRKALGAVLGTNYKQFVSVGGVERTDIETYLAAWDKQHKVNVEGDSKAVISAGGQGWTMPIPIVKRKAGWQFDMAAGADEMRTRRIGRNEAGHDAGHPRLLRCAARVFRYRPQWRRRARVRSKVGQHQG